jgi:F-type H+-transporting ATPase subunit delta
MAAVGKIQPGTIELEEKLDDKLIGGFVLRVGDQMIDASVLAKIRALNREFSENPYISEL